MIYINGHDLTIEQVIAVSREGETVAIAPEAVERINAARAYVDRKLADKAVVYGLTTGFGKFSTVFVPEEETAELQRNLIISHACGMGEPLDTRVVRAAMLLRLNALARGNSGIRLSTMETLLAMLNRGSIPLSRRRAPWRQRRPGTPGPHGAGDAGRGRGGVSGPGATGPGGYGCRRHRDHPAGRQGGFGPYQWHPDHDGHRLSGGV